MKKLINYDQAKGKTISSIEKRYDKMLVMIFTDCSFLISGFNDFDWYCNTDSIEEMSYEDCCGYEHTIIAEKMEALKNAKEAQRVLAEKEWDMKALRAAHQTIIDIEAKYKNEL